MGFHLFFLIFFSKASSRNFSFAFFLLIVRVSIIKKAKPHNPPAIVRNNPFAPSEAHLHGAQFGILLCLHSSSCCWDSWYSACSIISCSVWVIFGIESFFDLSLYFDHSRVEFLERVFLVHCELLSTKKPLKMYFFSMALIAL